MCPSIVSNYTTTSPGRVICWANTSSMSLPLLYATTVIFAVPLTPPALAVIV
jgi:hypothetical protein